ncbi:hypothetical protein TREPR_1043 [Treponema primitia ZAS-2]|uniref:Uncharacterized protein n=1 Tax=Treponema primitia (strain ATCC BAA-887 / DSM 12427 / ZAS-2) TaxID=545694 RepID=F5YHN4_TREPZ|nr:hypothetical protein TREPR_1043 [Treponema primitia ZAS-2]
MTFSAAKAQNGGFWLACLPKTWYVLEKGNEMTINVKPVQPTHIKGKGIYFFP